jgi:hypothetical protein
MVTTVKSIDDLIQELARRVYRVEQRVTNPVNFPSGGTNEFEEIWLGPEGDRRPVGVFVQAPTGLILTPGAFYDLIFVDVDWDVVDDQHTVAYEVQYAEKDPITSNYLQPSYVQTVGTGVRVSGLKPETTYGFRVIGINRIGMTSIAPAYTDVTTIKDATIPEAVTGLRLSAGLTSIMALWDESPEPDVRWGAGQYEVQLSANDDFPDNEPGIEYTRIVYTTSTLASFSDLMYGAELFVRVRAIDASGNAGPWSAVVSAITLGEPPRDFVQNPLTHDEIGQAIIDVENLRSNSITQTKIAPDSIATPHLQANSVTTLAIAAETIITGHIAANQIVSDHIAANQIHAGHIIANQITGQHIAANSISAADAVFQNAAIQSADIANLSAGKLSAGELSVSAWISSPGFTSGSQGWIIRGDGTAEFQGVIIRGSLNTRADLNTSGIIVSGSLLQVYRNNTWVGTLVGTLKNGNAAMQVSAAAIGTPPSIELIASGSIRDIYMSATSTIFENNVQIMNGILDVKRFYTFETAEFQAGHAIRSYGSVTVGSPGVNDVTLRAGERSTFTGGGLNINWDQSMIEVQHGSRPRIAFHVPGMTAPQLSGTSAFPDRLWVLTTGGNVYGNLQLSDLYVSNWFWNSDVRRKHDLQVLEEDPLEVLSKVKVRSYLEDEIVQEKGRSVTRRSPVRRIGVIANDLPEYAKSRTNPDPNKPEDLYETVSGSALVTLLVGSVQSLSKRIELLERALS